VDGTPPRAGRPGGVPEPLAPWTDPDAAFFTVGQAGDLLGVPAATLRRFDAAGAVSPARSAGGQRRYSSRQLSHARRLVDLVAEGLPLQAATRIAALEDEVEQLRRRLRRDGAGPA
jgi:MerR family transcriptional regulator/heat shock protein HspR